MTTLHVKAFLINKREGVAHIAKYDPFGEVAGSWCGQTGFDVESNVPWGNPTCEACIEKATGPDSLEARLRAAEDVCVMFAWSPSRHESDRDKAAHELWLRWVALSGNDCSTEQNPHLTDDLIAELAAKRDATRSATLQHFFGPEVEG